MRFSKKTSEETPCMEDAIKTAIIQLKERPGSTMASIIKFINAHWPDMQPQTLRTVSRRMVNQGELIKIKKSYKISGKAIVKKIKETKKQKQLSVKSKPSITKEDPPKEVAEPKQRKKPGRKPRKIAKEEKPDVIVLKDEPLDDVATQAAGQIPKLKRGYRRREAVEGQDTNLKERPMKKATPKPRKAGRAGKIKK